MNIPAVILQFIHSEDNVPNEYVPYSDINQANQALIEYFRTNGTPHDIGIYVNTNHGEEYAKTLQKTAKDITNEIIGVYGISDAILRLI